MRFGFARNESRDSAEIVLILTVEDANTHFSLQFSRVKVSERVNLGFARIAVLGGGQSSEIVLRVPVDGYDTAAHSTNGDVPFSVGCFDDFIIDVIEQSLKIMQCRNARLYML